MDAFSISMLLSTKRRRGMTDSLGKSALFLYHEGIHWLGLLRRLNHYNPTLSHETFVHKVKVLAWILSRAY